MQAVLVFTSFAAVIFLVLAVSKSLVMLSAFIDSKFGQMSFASLAVNALMISWYAIVMITPFTWIK
jgi:hypothetical protein